jgi:hypothetical protein
MKKMPAFIFFLEAFDPPPDPLASMGQSPWLSHNDVVAGPGGRLAYLPRGGRRAGSTPAGWGGSPGADFSSVAGGRGTRVWK